MAKLRIQRVFNNNVVLSKDINNNEIVVMGRGIGFGKKTGDDVDPQLIEKTFVLEAKNQHLSDLYQMLPSEEVDLMVEIIDYAEKQLKTVFQANLYLSLADHLHYAIERYHQGFYLANPLAYEVEKYYPYESQLGQDVLKIINKRLGLKLDEAEATSIALHFINAQHGNNLNKETIKMMQVIEDIINIVRLDLKLPIDYNSIAYHRFVTHLQYFLRRVFDNELSQEMDGFLFEEVQKNYPESYLTACKIKHYIEEKFDYNVCDDEIFYLTIHLQRFKH